MISYELAKRNYPIKGGYNAVHIWLRYHFGSANKCENKDCIYPRKNNARSWVRAPKRFDWALKKGFKYEHIRDNFIQLCPSCHKRYDMGLISINL